MHRANRPELQVDPAELSGENPDQWIFNDSIPLGDRVGRLIELHVEQTDPRYLDLAEGLACSVPYHCSRESRLAVCQAHLDSGDIGSAERLARAALRDSYRTEYPGGGNYWDPDDCQKTLQKCVQAHLREDDISAAEAVAESMSTTHALYPLRHGAFFEIGRAALEAGEVRTARRIASSAKHIGGNQEKLWERIADTYLAEGNPQAALKVAWKSMEDSDGTVLQVADAYDRVELGAGLTVLRKVKHLPHVAEYVVGYDRQDVDGALSAGVKIIKRSKKNDARSQAARIIAEYAIERGDGRLLSDLMGLMNKADRTRVLAREMAAERRAS